MSKKEEILKLIKSDPKKFLSKIGDGFYNYSEKEELLGEFKDLKRDYRDTQIGNIQKAKFVGKGESLRKVDPVKTPIPFQNKIVKTATAFEVGESVNTVPSIENTLTNEIDRLWERNRMDALVQQAVFMRKSQKESAILFYIKKISSGESFNRIKGVNDKKEIKTKLLDNSKGKMTPIFDDMGDMIYFVWQFKTKDFDGVEKENIWVYDEENVYTLSKNAKGETLSSPAEKHGFDRIPIAYTSQDYVEWHEAEAMIDRIEVVLSKLGASNDYAGHPILKLYGEVKGAPDKDEDGKAFHIEQNEKPDGSIVQGDAKFLTHDNAPEAVKIEMDRLEKYIHSMTSTPDITFHNIKGLGSISGYAIELMFMDAIIKAKTNNTIQNKPFIERCTNIMISGIVTTLRPSLASQAEETIFDVKFNSILPKDVERSVQTYMNAVNSGIATVDTAVKNLNLAHDADQEIEQLKSENTKNNNNVADN